jgi:hypothetical protein
MPMMSPQKHCAHFIAIVLACFSLSHAGAQTVNSQWKKDLNQTMESFQSCASTPEENSACENFTGEALKAVYNVNDFYSTRQGGYIRTSEISRQIRDGRGWTLLGPSYDQKVLMTAQEFANTNKAVVAVFTNSSNIGHVVIILPGQLTSSGSWGLKVPNCASFLLADRQKSFVDKALSYAFTKNMLKDVQIYARVY